MKIVINGQYGGFGLSDKAYERLIELGVPVQKYHPEEQGMDGRYKPQPLNDGKVIFDRTLTLPEEDKHGLSGEKHIRLLGRYWETWISENRTHPLLIKVVEELGKDASGRLATLKVIEVPNDVKWEIDEYDGLEHIAEKHRTWS